MTIYESGSLDRRTFHLKGNGTYPKLNGKAVVRGRRKSRLGEKKKRRIANALKHPHVDRVYMRGGTLYRLLANGSEGKLNENDYYGMAEEEREALYR